jgi:hypothetical protein
MYPTNSVACAYPLPTEPPAFARGNEYPFSTMAFAERGGSHYRISSEGLLVDAAGALVDHTGDVHLHATNMILPLMGTPLTHDGEDAESITYEVRFDHGRVAHIRETHRTREPAVKVRW